MKGHKMTTTTRTDETPKARNDREHETRKAQRDEAAAAVSEQWKKEAAK